MEAPDQRRQYVGVVRIDNCRPAHRDWSASGAEADAILTAIELTELETGNLGNGIGLIGRLQRA